MDIRQKRPKQRTDGNKYGWTRGNRWFLFFLAFLARTTEDQPSVRQKSKSCFRWPSFVLIMARSSNWDCPKWERNYARHTRATDRNPVGRWEMTRSFRLNDSHQSDGQKFGAVLRFFRFFWFKLTDWNRHICWKRMVMLLLWFFRFSAIELSSKHYLSGITEIDHWLLLLFLPVLLALSQIDPTIIMAIEKSTVYYFVSTRIVESIMHIELCFRNKKGFVSFSYWYGCFQRTWNQCCASWWCLPQISKYYEWRNLNPVETNTSHHTRTINIGANLVNKQY